MRTAKQKAAQERNYLIMRLRGVYRLFEELHNEEGKQLVDGLLEKMGAKTCAQKLEEFKKLILKGN